MLLKKILFIFMIASISSCGSRIIKLPKTIRIDTIKRDYSEYRISYNFEYNNKNQLVTIIDSTKKREKIIIQELCFNYNKNDGKLKSYIYKTNTDTIQYEIVYDINTINMFPKKGSNLEYLITLNNSDNALEIKSVDKANSYYNSITKPIYYKNGNLKQMNKTKFKFSNSKGIFSDINMEPWARLYFSHLVKQRLNFSKNLLIMLSKGEKFKANYKYVIQKKYPIRIIHPLITYKIAYYKKHFN